MLLVDVTSTDDVPSPASALPHTNAIIAEVTDPGVPAACHTQSVGTSSTARRRRRAPSCDSWAARLHSDPTAALQSLRGAVLRLSNAGDDSEFDFDDCPAPAAPADGGVSEESKAGDDSLEVLFDAALSNAHDTDPTKHAATIAEALAASCKHLRGEPMGPDLPSLRTPDVMAARITPTIGPVDDVSPPGSFPGRASAEGCLRGFGPSSLQTALSPFDEAALSSSISRLEALLASPDLDDGAIIALCDAVVVQTSLDVALSAAAASRIAQCFARPENVVAAACRALSQLVGHVGASGSSASAAFISAGGVRALVSAITRLGGAAAAVNTLSSAVRALADMRPALPGAPLAPLLVPLAGVLGRHPPLRTGPTPSTVSVTAAATALRSIIRGGGPALQDAAAACGVVAHAKTALAAFASDALAAAALCGILRSLAHKHAANRAALGAVGSVPLLIAVIAEHGDSPAVLEQACGALCVAVTGSPLNADEARRHGAPAKLLCVWRQVGGEGPVASSAAAVLTALDPGWVSRRHATPPQGGSGSGSGGGGGSGGKHTVAAKPRRWSTYSSGASAASAPAPATAESPTGSGGTDGVAAAAIKETPLLGRRAVGQSPLATAAASQVAATPPSM